MATPRRISDIKPLFTNLAQTSHYEVKFGGLPDPLIKYLNQRGITSRFIVEDAGLLCNNAVLPTTQLSTAEISGNYVGITETFAHKRQYQDITLEFYVDKNYKTLKFLEHWMEFIASGSSNPINSTLTPLNSNSDTYFIRMQYPEYYKSNKTRIVKFDRDYKKEIEYTFIGLYPYNINSIPVSYAQSDVMKMSVSFKIDRYVVGKSLSLDIYRNIDNNKESNRPDKKPPRNELPRRLVPISPGAAAAGGVRFVDPNASPYERATQQYYDAQGSRRAP